MNPFLIVGGIAALLIWSKNAKGAASAPSVGTPIPSPANPAGLDAPVGPTPSNGTPAPSPANPAGLDAPLGPSPSGVPEIRETTPEPIESPANPAGLDAPLGPSPSGVPEIRETTTETATEVVAAEPEIVVVNDPNWTPSPANPAGLNASLNPTGTGVVTIDTSAGASDYTYFQSEKAKAFEQQLLQTGFYDPQAGIGLLPHTSNFWYWALYEKLPQYTDVKGTMGSGPFKRFLIRKLDEDLNLLNSTGIEQFKIHMQKKQAIQKASEEKKNAPVVYPPVKDGLVHMGNGVYGPATSQAGCPEGYVYLNNNPYFQGNFGCISQARWEEIVLQKIPQINPMPASVWQQVIQLNFAGRFTDRSVLTMPAQELIKVIRDRTIGCSNQWCKVVQDLFLTDTTIFANDRFTFKGVVWATMDENYIAFYPIPVKAGGSTRTASPVYAMFPVTKAEYEAYKVFYTISNK